MTARPLAVTMGEPAGIGGEIIVKAWAARSGGARPFFVIDDPDRLEPVAESIGHGGRVVVIEHPDQAAGVFAGALPVLPQRLAKPVVPGKPDPENGAAVIASIDRAVALVSSGDAAGMVTIPIQKSALYAAGFRHPGHTEYLAHLAGLSHAPIMMLATPALRVVPVTIHIALAAVPAALRGEDIIHAGLVTDAALRRDFGIGSPRIAVAALNPHAGESGAMGREEIEIISPAIASLRQQGIDASGPYPADTLFHAAARKRYDAVLCMYHDQALIPLKTISFEDGVNVTLGLPFVRTSPDHGTALDIAGKNIADATSLLAAIDLADRMAQARQGRGH